jgi:hypothetical protein
MNEETRQVTLRDEKSGSDSRHLGGSEVHGHQLLDELEVEVPQRETS